MADYDRKFRDLEQRLSRAKAMSETVMLGGAGGRTNASTMMLGDGQVEKPMLGRYQIEKELGKGRHGRGLSRTRSEDQLRGGDQDHGLVAGVRRRGTG